MESNEPLITLTAATKLKWLPRRRKGARPHLSTILRWVVRGVGGVRLEAWKVGNAWCTTERSLRGFFEKLAAGPTASPESAPKRDDVERAEAVLDRAGIR
jgi:hypothetical protein